MTYNNNVEDGLRNRWLYTLCLKSLLGESQNETRSAIIEELLPSSTDGAECYLETFENLKPTSTLDLKQGCALLQSYNVK